MIANGSNDNEKEVSSIGGKVFIIVAQLGENLSSFGQKYLMNQFLKSGLSLPNYQAKAAIHFIDVFTCLGSFMSSALSDSYWGNYKTSLIFFIPCIIGIILRTIFSIPGLLATFGQFPVWSYIIPALLTAMGLGSLRTNLIILGVEQYPSHAKQAIESYFSLTFFISTLSRILVVYTIPLLKDKVQCFGYNCYFLSFGTCSIFIISGFLFFIMGHFKYLKVPPQGKFLYYRIFKITFQKFQAKKNNVNLIEEKEFIKGLEQFWKVVSISIIMSLSTLLSDQITTEWQNQYELMSKHILGIYVPTEAVSLIGTLFVLVITPTLSYIIYPQFSKPLSITFKLVLGYLLLILSFIVAAILNYPIQQVSHHAIYSQGIVISCDGCLSGSWQFIQYFIFSLAITILFPAYKQFLYDNVTPPFKSTGSALNSLTTLISSFLIVILEITFKSSANIHLRTWLYIILSSGGLIILIWVLYRSFNLSTTSSSDT